MRIRDFTQLFAKDFKQEFQQLIEQLGQVFNDYLISVNEALKNQLSLQDNLYCEVKELDVQINQQNTPIATTSFKLLKIKGKIAGISVIQITNLSNINTIPTTFPYLNYQQNNDIITINQITGLPINNKFRLKLIVWG